MSEDELKERISNLLQELTCSGAIHTPIAAFDLFKKLVSHGGTKPGETVPRLRLTDLPKLEDILEKLAVSWDAGYLSVLRDGNGLMVMQLDVGRKGASPGYTRKRKRPVDEDADSAEEEAAMATPALSKGKPSAAASLSNLSKDLQEIYALLQRGTARQKLLSEQVSMLPSFPTKSLFTFSFRISSGPQSHSSRYVRTLRRMIVLRRGPLKRDKLLLRLHRSAIGSTSGLWYDHTRTSA